MVKIDHSEMVSEMMDLLFVSPVLPLHVCVPPQ
jgi:hypothetical protein